MPMNKNNYWAERARKDKIKVINTGEKGIDNLKRLLLLNLKDVEKQIKDFYEKYGENPAEELSNKNWQRYKKRLRDMAQANPQDKTLQKLAKQNIPKYKIDRLRALELDLQMQLTEATNGQAKGIYNTLDDVSKVSQATLASRMDKTLGLTFNAISANKMKQILMSDWSGANWSERLWKDREKVGKKLTEVLEKGIPQGTSLQKMSRELRDITGESFNNAFRLIRTETSHIDGQVTLEGYKQASNELGLEYYEYDAFLDTRTSSICRELNGNRFKVSEAEVGVNYPPMHPNCRSTTQLVLDEDYKQEEAQKEKVEFDKTPETKDNTLFDDKKIFVPAKDIAEAKAFAEANGVKYAMYENMSLEYANEINKALLTIPINFRPAVIMDMNKAVKTELIHKSRASKAKRAYGVCQQLYGYENKLTSNIEERNKLMYRYAVAYNSNKYKTFKKLQEAKTESNKLYKEKFGYRYNFNLDGKATIYHEMAHCYANNYEIPKGFEPLANKWYQETKIKQIEKVSEAWAEAFAGYHIDNPELPDYIKNYMKGLKL